MAPVLTTSPCNNHHVGERCSPSNGRTAIYMTWIDGKIANFSRREDSQPNALLNRIDRNADSAAILNGGGNWQFGGENHILHWGAFIYDVRTRGRGGPKKQTKGTQSADFRMGEGDVRYGSPLTVSLSPESVWTFDRNNRLHAIPTIAIHSHWVLRMRTVPVWQIQTTFSELNKLYYRALL